MMFKNSLVAPRVFTRGRNLYPVLKRRDVPWQNLEVIVPKLLGVVL